MNLLIKRSSQLVLKGIFLLTFWTNAQAAELDPVLNVQLDGDQLTWDAVDTATGYNIYLRGIYITTVTDERRFTVSETGTYGVTAFDNDGNFSPLRGSNFPFFEGGIDNRPRVISVGEGIAIITQRCFDVGAGESCIARCPDFIGGNPGFFIGGASGGACSSSDTANVNASIINTREYSCTVSGFTSRVESQVACLVTE